MLVLTGVLGFAMKDGVVKQVARWETLASTAAGDLANLRADFAALTAVLASPANQEWRDIKNLLSHNPNINPQNLETSRDAVLSMYHSTGKLPVSDMDILNHVFAVQRQVMGLSQV